MERVTTVADLRSRLASVRAQRHRVALVPTMGALHEGHLSLVRLAADLADTVVVSVFVNPTQFDRPDDLATYPRDLAGDEASLSRLGPATPAIVFAPQVSEMYPQDPLTTVHVARLTDRLCGAARPGHFDGVTTVVMKLLDLVQPDVAVFGRKDAQQLRVLTRMVEDLNVPVQILAAPIVREADGLALASRNRRLSDTERTLAPSLSRALRAAVETARRARRGGRAPTPESLWGAAAAALAAVPAVRIDYLEVVDPDTLAPPEQAVEGASGGRLLVAVAAFVGSVRLIDNVEIGDLDDEQRLLDATTDLGVPLDPDGTAAARLREG